jgi:O-acetyl-ADP-ribose deacetylase
VRTLAFPAISTGAFGYPLSAATQIAIGETASFLERNDLPERVVFVCFDERARSIYEDALRKRGEAI